MGPESGPMVAYLDGQPVEIGTPLPEITPDYSAGGVTAEVAAGLERFIYSLEFGLAINLGTKAGIGPPISPHKEKEDPQEIQKADHGLVSGGVPVNVQTESQQSQPLQAGGRI